jgi:bis(5'-nucleosidyl)-tetraphosphatase
MIAFEKSIGAVIFRKEDDKIYYLLLDYGNNYWSFAKGHIDKGETEEETMRREVMEETGITDLEIIPGFYKGTRYFYQAQGEEKSRRKKEGRKSMIMKQVKYFLVQTNAKEVKISHEHQDFEWLPYEEAIIKITYQNSKKVLKKAKRYLEKSLPR